MNFSISENAIIGAIVGTISVDDAEDGLFTFSITSGNSDGFFAVDNQGLITLVESCLLEFNAFPSFSLNVAVSDDDFDVTGTITVTVTEFIDSAPTSGLVAYYPFNGDASDGSNNAFDGTITGASLTSDRYGCNDKAYNLIPLMISLRQAQI